MIKAAARPTSLRQRPDPAERALENFGWRRRPASGKEAPPERDSGLFLLRAGRAMQAEETAIPAVKIVTPKKHGDARGFFSEVYNKSAWDKSSLDFTFVQDNHSYSAGIGTLRGLHFQTPPFAQDKLVRVGRGRILDVAVDIRRSSPTFGRYVATELSADNWRQLLIPIGFAHGFVTLEPDTEVLYKTTANYSLEHDRGVAWDDPEIGIKWPLPAGGPLLSDKDRGWPRLRDAQDLFA
jgi:dTDP-4-dehydrorhamnose 3,5-epimerase